MRIPAQPWQAWQLLEKGFILAAGLGTRLRPLTRALPKPLLPILGRPLLDFAVRGLTAQGARRLAFNTHHLAEAFRPYQRELTARGLEVATFHEPALLDTGGALVNAQAWIGRDPLVVVSGDVLTDLDLDALAAAHRGTGATATMALRRTPLAEPVAFDPQTGRVTDLLATLGQPAPERLDYANALVIEGGVLARYPAGERRSLVAILLDLLRRGDPVGGVRVDGIAWHNVGTRAEYLGVHAALLSGVWRPAVAPEPWWRPEEVAGEVRAKVSGVSWVSAAAELAPEAVVHDSVVWAGSRLLAGTKLDGCVVAGRPVPPGAFQAEDFV